MPRSAVAFGLRRRVVGIYQPFGVTKLFSGIWNAHPKFTTKTVLVKENDIDDAFHLLNGMMSREGLINIIRRTLRFEKPCQQRNRIAMEISSAIYNEDMSRKIKFLMRKNRKDPFPGQY